MITQLLNLIGISPVLILKIVFLTLFLFHSVFALILSRQTRKMTSAIEARVSYFLYLITIAHFGLSTILFFLTLFFI